MVQTRSLRFLWSRRRDEQFVFLRITKTTELILNSAWGSQSPDDACGHRLTILSCRTQQILTFQIFLYRLEYRRQIDIAGDASGEAVLPARKYLPPVFSASLAKAFGWRTNC